MEPSRPVPTPPGGTPSAEALLEALPGGVLVLDEQGVVRRVNEQFVRWCGMPAAALLGQPLAAARLPAALRSALLPLPEAGAAEPREVFLPGQERWLAFSATRQPGGWVLYGQDITPQKQREQQYQTLAENTPDVLARWGPDLRLRYANAAFAAKMGQPLEALMGRTFAEMDAPAAIAGPYMAALEGVFATGQPQEHHNPFPGPHGPTFFYSRLVPELRDGRPETVLGIARDITALKQAEREALRLGNELTQRTTDQYQALFQSMEQGFCVLEVLFNETGQQAVDFRYLELNPVFARQSGMPDDALGKTAREVLPDLKPFWFDTYGRVARTGQPVRVEHYVPPVGRWFDVHAFRVGAPAAGRVAVLFNDITDRKRREADLLFLAEVSQALAHLTDIDATLNALGAQLAAHLGLSACAFAELFDGGQQAVISHGWHRADAPSLLGTYRMAEFMTPEVVQLCREGKAVIVRDVFADPRIDGPQYAALRIGSFVTMPLVRDGEWRFLLAVYRAAPHDWRAHEIDLIREATARIWARLERARAEQALAASEEKYRTLFNSIDEGYALIELLYDAGGRVADFLHLEVNPRAEQINGFVNMSGRRIRELVPAVEDYWLELYGRVAATGEPARIERYVAAQHRWFSVYASRVGAAGSRFVAAVFDDITARKQHEQRQTFLLALSDALRPLADAAKIQRTATRLVGEYLGLDRAMYAEILPDGETAVVNDNYLSGRVPAFTGTFSLAAYGALVETARHGTPLVVADVNTETSLTEAEKSNYKRTGSVAFVAIPLLKGGRWVANLVGQQDAPRRWTPDEVALLQETAERTWAAVERSRAEEAQRTSEQRLRGVIENLPGAAVFIVDAALRYQLAAGAGLRQAGFEPADFVGRRVQEMAPPGLWPDFRHQYEQALAGQVFEYEHTQNGRTFATRGGPLREADGPVAAVLAVSYDITARKQAEAALQESEVKYRNLFDSMDEGYCIIEMLFDAAGQPNDWRFVEVNPAFEKNNGLTNATGKTIRELTPNIEPKWFATYGRVAQTGEPLRFEEDSAALGRCFTLYAFPVGGAGSNLVAVLFTDITARKQAEDALRLSEERLSLALQAGRMGTFEWTSDGDRITLSATSEEVLGLLPGPRFATSAEGFALLHPDDHARHHAIFEEACRTGHDYHSIFRIVRPRDGAVRWIEERGQGTRHADAGVVCLRGVHWDVTEVMLAQQRLAEFNTRLEQRVARRTRDLQASRDLLQSVFDTNLIAMSVQEAVCDETGAVQDFRLRLVSGELVRTTGRTDLVGKLYTEEYPGIRDAGIFDLAVRALETGQPQGMEYHYPYDGFDQWFACQFVRLGDNGIVATNLDITERKTAEQERLKNLRLLEQAEAVAGLGSWDYDLATGTMHWSEGMYQLFGLPAGSPVAPADYLGRVVAEDRPRAEQLVQRLAAGAGDSEETLRLQVAGRVKTVRMKSVVLRDAQGQAVRVLGVDLDISELQRLEQDNLRLRLTQQRALFEAVQAAQEAERKRMAESLHNGIGQILYATKLHLDRLHAPLLGTDPALVAARHEADQLLGEAIRQTRALSHELVPMALAEFGLAAALQDICRKMSSPQLRFHCSVQLDDDAAPLAPALQMALYRMAQELTQNVVKHARGATEAGLELETMPGWVLFRAEDNGSGLATAPAASTGLGLRSIRDRVALLGGRLEIGSVPGGGAYVRIRIPLPVLPTP